MPVLLTGLTYIVVCAQTSASDGGHMPVSTTAAIATAAGDDDRDEALQQAFHGFQVVHRVSQSQLQQRTESIKRSISHDSPHAVAGAATAVTPAGGMAVSDLSRLEGGNVAVTVSGVELGDLRRRRSSGYYEDDHSLGL